MIHNLSCLEHELYRYINHNVMLRFSLGKRKGMHASCMYVMCSWLTYSEINGGRKEKISIYDAEQDEHGERVEVKWLILLSHCH